MSTDDPYLPPAGELREERPPRHFGRVLVGCLLAYTSAAGLMLATDPVHSLDLKAHTEAVLTGLGVGALLLQFRELPWSLLAMVAPPTAVIVVIVLSFIADLTRL